MLPDQMFINGGWQDSQTGKQFPTIDPATEERITNVPRGDAADVDLAVNAAQAALEGPWGAISPANRGRLMFKLAASIHTNRKELAELETRDVGKPLRDSLGDIDGVVETLEYNAGAADKLQGDTIPLGKDYIDFTLLEPVGVTAHITPWNFPLGMAVRSMAPALAAGCTAVLKPAEQSPLSTLCLAALAQEAGFPDGVINVVTGYGPEAGAALAKHPGVRGISFTGSVETGRQIMALAAPGLKPLVLELGGKNPLIVFPDANLERALDDTLEGAFGNCGQVCSAVSRLILHREIKETFLTALKEKVERLKVGPGMKNPDLGPLVSREQYEKVLDYIKNGLGEGAKLISGGQRPENLKHGYFIQPTIFSQAEPNMQISQEEIFGPVAVALDFSEEDEAVQIANNVSYGLVAGVYTQDISRALHIVRKLQTGSVWINGWYLGGVQAPVGGTKDSGFGRERGLAGILNYVQIKNIGIKL